MSITNKYPFLGSSVDSEKISLTIKSFGVWLIPAIIFIGKNYGIEIAETDLIDIINILAVTAGSIMTLAGLIRKVVNKYF